MATANATKLKADKLELPRFRYLDDYIRFLGKLRKDINDSGQLVQQYKKMFASMKKPQPVSAAMTFNVTPRDRKEQGKDVQRMKTAIDPTLKKVVIPNVNKLSTQYALSEDLHEKKKLLDSMESQLALQFPDRNGQAYNNAVSAIRVLKAQVNEQLKEVLGFLHEVATAHVPPTFQAYMDAIVQLIDKHVIFKDSDLFLYVSTTDKGELVFTYYLMLRDVVNDDGFVTPHLYISVQWLIGPTSSVEVQLNHEYELPNKLIGHGHEVGNVQDALSSISNMLQMESFSTALGMVPMALLMNTNPAKLTKDFFSFKDCIKSVTVDENLITFTLRPEITNPETIKEVAYQLYMELRKLVKRNAGAKLIMKQQAGPAGTQIVFNLSKIAEKGQISYYDLEFLRDKFSLSDSAMRKIAQIING